MPLGFFLILFSGSLPVVLVGEALFGLGAGQIYCAAFYYAMVSKNASVDAGGGHESVVGLGFTLGPAVGLLAVALIPMVGEIPGLLIGVGPLIAICVIGAILPMVKTRRV